MKPSQFLADAMAGARLEVLPGAGHSVNVEEPSIVNRLVDDFVAAAEAKHMSRNTDEGTKLKTARAAR
ncbi:MAG: hypothetical protein WAO08_13095 [Hyphomicrobiaceae bacterium]